MARTVHEFLILRTKKFISDQPGMSPIVNFITFRQFFITILTSWYLAEYFHGKLFYEIFELYKPKKNKVT